jgi:hypothetical protein
MLYRLLADLVLVAHAGFIAFVVLGQVLILIGGLRQWRWVRNRWFRIAHLLAIAMVIVQAWLGVVCPLTDLESELRIRGGQDPYVAVGCIQYWVQRAIFYTAPAWIFTLTYSLFGLLVVGTLLWVRPRWRRGVSAGEDGRATGPAAVVDGQDSPA